MNEPGSCALMTLHVESAAEPATLAAPVLAEIRRLDPGTPVEGVQTMDRFFEEGALFGNRLITQLVTVIGLFGLLLSVGGLYGVIAYSVSRRTREIGIRIAVGANPASVARLILRQGMKLTIVGGRDRTGALDAGVQGAREFAGRCERARSIGVCGSFDVAGYY